MKTLYYSLVHPHLIFNLLAWGYDNEPLFLMQKRAVRVVTGSHPIAHTDPLYRQLNILRLPDIHTQNQLKFFWRYQNNELPQYLQNIPLPRNRDYHDYYTRHCDDFRNARPNTEYERKVIRNSLPKLLNDLPECMRLAVEEVSVKSCASCFKNSCIETYEQWCNDDYCYPCSVVAASRRPHTVFVDFPQNM